MEIQEVPADDLLTPAQAFARPTVAHARACFEGMHAEAERVWHGGGVWAEQEPLRLAPLPAASRPLNVLNPRFPPLYRNTAWRVIGYTNGLRVAPDPLYRKRAIEGGEYLLREQQADGSFLYWRGREDGWPGALHLLFCTANPGCAFLELYRLTGDRRYREASRRAADWEANAGISPNANYNSFAVWHLCEHVRETGEDRYLESALEKTARGVFPGQLANGGWAGHNAWIFYHAIIVRGLAALYGLLPAGHAARPELRRRLIMAVNHLLAEQRASGRLRSCFDPVEWQKSRDPANAYSVHPEDKVDPFAIQALVCVLEWTELDVRSALYGLLSLPRQAELAQGQEGMMHLAYGVAYRWLAQTEGQEGTR